MLGRLFVGVASAVGAVLVLAVVLNAVGVLHTYVVPSSSMESTLHCRKPSPGCLGSHADRVLALRYVLGSPGRGDLVAFHTPPAVLPRCGAAGTFLKRIVGLPGEEFEERGGVVYIDGKRLDEPYIDPSLRDTRTIAPARVPEDSYVVLGDNRSSSCDSRVWGALPRENVIGRVVGVYWPPGRIGIP